MELSRAIIVLETDKDIKLQYSYNYELMKEIYKNLTSIDETFANHLHNVGYCIENKRYKLFTHHLYIKYPEYKKDYIKIKKNTRCELIISGLKEIVQKLSFALLENRKLYLFNDVFNVKSIESDRKINLDKITLYKATNPIVATRLNDKGQIIYVNPLEPDFFRIIANNLKRKYKLIYGKEYKGNLFFDIENTLSIKKKLISNIRSKYIIIGYSGFELFIEADKDMQKVAYYCGLGGYNSLGMGLVNYITSRRD